MKQFLNSLLALSLYEVSHFKVQPHLFHSDIRDRNLSFQLDSQDLILK